MDEPKLAQGAEADGPPSGSATKQKLAPASGNSIGGTGSKGKQKKQSARTLLKVGLFMMVAFHFSWVAKQLSVLGDSSSLDGALIAPEYDEDGSDVRASSIDAGGRTTRVRHTSIYDPRGRPLPKHESPNAELQALVSSREEYDCPNELVYVKDHVMPDNVTHPPGRKIPYLFHITAKSRCMTAGFAENIERWKRALGSKYSIYIHDDDAVNKFIYQRQWMEFPELKEVMGCVTAGAAKADIWRYVMVWEYGGIYSDMDSSPNKFSVDSIRDGDDAFFPLEMLGIPAQYWFAASPRHPVMYLSAKHSLQTMAFRDDISNNNAAKTTGPGAFKSGFILWSQFANVNTNGYVLEGTYSGSHGRTVRVVGSRGNSNEWIIREGVKGKGGAYKTMGMTHFHATKQQFRETHQNRVVGCLEQRYRMHTDMMADWVNIV